MSVGYNCSKELYDLLGPNTTAGDFSEFPESAREEFDELLLAVKADWGDSHEFKEVFENSLEETGEYILFFDSVS